MHAAYGYADVRGHTNTDGMVVRYGFDNLKVDGCSAQRDVAMWSGLINKTGTYTELENCNNGPNPTTPVAGGGCPYYHQYRPCVH